MEEQLARGPMDLPFLMLVVLLTGIGVIMVFSASYATAYYEGRDPTFYFFRQGLFAVAGLAIMYVVSKINYQTFRWLSVFALIVAILLLIAVLIPGIHTDRSDNVKRWIAVPGIGTFQPSEIAKVAVIMYFSSRLSKRNTEKPVRLPPRSPLSGVVGLLDRIGFLELVPYALILLLIVGLMMMEPHMSGTLLILAGAAAVLFAAGIKLYWFLGGGALLAGMVLLLMSGYQSTRILVWQDPWAYPQDGGWQIIQSLYAIGSGGLLGLGLGKSRQKFLYLPDRGGGDPHPVCPAGDPGLLDRHPRPGSVRRPAGGGHHHPDGGAGVPQHRCGHQPDPHHRHFPALLQLRRHGPDDPAGRDGRCAVGVQADSADETGVKQSRGDAVPPRYKTDAPPEGRHNGFDTPLSPARRGRPWPPRPGVSVCCAGACPAPHIL